VSIVRATTVGLLFTISALDCFCAQTPTQDDINKLTQQLAVNIAAVTQSAQPLVICQPPSATCPFRLWVAQAYLSGTLDQLLNNQSLIYDTTGFRTPNLAGGDALGCGWYVNVTAFGASLHISTISPVWETAAGQIRLSLSPAFNFSAQAQLAGHVNGPPGPCHIFDWSCSCPIGGGIGASVGVGATANDQLGLLVALTPSQQNLGVQVSQPNAKTITVNASIGLGILGTVGFPIPITVPSSTLYNTQFPMAFGTSGGINLPQGARYYQINVVSPAVSGGDNGVVATFGFQFIWQ